jgi:hypothetical protein
MGVRDQGLGIMGQGRGFSLIPDPRFLAPLFL